MGVQMALPLLLRKPTWWGHRIAAEIIRRKEGEESSPNLSPAFCYPKISFYSFSKCLFSAYHGPGRRQVLSEKDFILPPRCWFWRADRHVHTGTCTVGAGIDVTETEATTEGWDGEALLTRRGSEISRANSLETKVSWVLMNKLVGGGWHGA